MSKIFIICKKVFINLLKFFNPFDIYKFEEIKDINYENYIEIN